MAGRPRKDEQIKTKGRKGTGTINKCVQKNDRKERRLPKMCKICSECKDRSICKNRVGTKACEKCKKCTNKNCDRFYISIKYKAFSPQVNNTLREYLGSFDTQNEAQESINKYINGGFVEKNNISLFDLLQGKNNIKRSANTIKSSTDDRNRAVRNRMKKSGIGDKAIQKITTKDVQDYLNSLKDIYSQSELDKQRDEANSGFNYAIKHNIVKENPVANLEKVISNKKTKKARPFELDEQLLVLDYINDDKNLIKLTDIRSTMDGLTFRNIVNLVFCTGQRIGEILALQHTAKKNTSDINFEKKFFVISKTITTENNKLVLGNSTKNAEKRRKQGLPEEREVSFNIAPPNIIENIFKSQIEHLKDFKVNPKHFLFCNSKGKFITQHQVTDNFKRICRELHIQEDNPQGCYIHQARHSFVTRCLEARNESRNNRRPYRRYS